MAKDPKTHQTRSWNAFPGRWIDGSVDNDIPMAKLSELFNVNYFIVSQVNPHIVPFLEESSTARKLFHGSRKNKTPRDRDTSLHSMAVNLVIGQVTHRMRMMSELGIFPFLCTKVQVDQLTKE
jgi:TAG lipase / steryl ester hydrolase / phospholipase A2 / LPA acyltransferase